MVETFLAGRGLERLPRQRHSLNDGLQIQLNIWPWPYVCAAVFTFDCEGKYGELGTIDEEAIVLSSLTKMLRKKGVEVTFNFVGKVVEEHPDVVKGVDKAGHDIAGHGYSHIMMDNLKYKQQEIEIEKTKRAIHEVTGHSIRGWRSPCLSYNSATYTLLAKNFEWSSNWSRSLWGKLPFFPIINKKKYEILEIPVDEVHHDLTMYIFGFNTPPKEAANLWYNQILVTKKEHSLFVFLFHPAVLNQKARLGAVEFLINKSVSFGDVWVTSCSSVAQRWREIKKVKLELIKFVRQSEKIDVIIELFNSNIRPVDDATLLITNIPKHLHILEHLHELAWEFDFCSSSKILHLKMPKLEPNEKIPIEISFRKCY